MKRSVIAVMLVAMLVMALAPGAAPTAAQDEGLLIWADATRAPALV